jgi:hypothetical protein
VGLPLGVLDFFASVQIEWRWARLWGYVRHHCQGAISRQVVWGMLSFSSVWWRHNLREVFGGALLAVDYSGGCGLSVDTGICLQPLLLRLEAGLASCGALRLVARGCFRRLRVCGRSSCGRGCRLLRAWILALARRLAFAFWRLY